MEQEVDDFNFGSLVELLNLRMDEKWMQRNLQLST